ncbi:recombinase family protein [Enterobacter bugandensis]|nr:recombinase family protein [Enterobacter bugandensis]
MSKTQICKYANMQIDQLQQAGCDEIFCDTASGTKTMRPALEQLLGKIRSGDVIVIWKLDRLGRSLRHLIELVNQLMEKNVGLKSL